MRTQRAPDQTMPLCLLGEFAEFDQFTEFAAAWDIDFRQISRGSLNSHLLQSVHKSWSLARAKFNQPTYQEGNAVSGMRSFAIFNADSSGSHWCGQTLIPGRIGIFAPDGEFKSVGKSKFDVFTLSFTEDELDRAYQRLGIPDINRYLPESALVKDICRNEADKICRQVNIILGNLYQTRNLDYLTVDQVDQYDAITESLALLLNDSARIVQTPSQRRQSQALKKAIEVIQDGLEENITVRDVAAASNVSIRTLEYSFKNKFGTSPKQFINLQRLLMVRRDLLACDNESVTDIANRWGFWHMGQFANDYRRVFGELPSQTRTF